MGCKRVEVEGVWENSGHGLAHRVGGPISTNNTQNSNALAGQARRQHAQRVSAHGMRERRGDRVCERDGNRNGRVGWVKAIFQKCLELEYLVCPTKSREPVLDSNPNEYTFR